MFHWLSTGRGARGGWGGAASWAPGAGRKSPMPYASQGPECLNSIDLRWDLDIPIFTSPLGVSRVEDHKGRLILSFCIGGNEVREEEATYPG